MLVLITGGSKNGKSRIAEKIIENYDVSRFYIATMQPFGEEAHVAIERHRKMRKSKKFETIEKYTDIDEIILPEKCAVLLECACNLCANEMFSANEKNPVGKIVNDLERLIKRTEIFVIVTNQVGEDGVEYPDSTMKYIENMGKINLELSKMADVVIEAVYGIPVFLKGEISGCIL